MMRWPGKCLPVVLLALNMTLSAARRLGDPLKPDFNLFTRDDDMQVGKEAAAEIRQRLKVVPNAFLQDYIARIGKRISAQSEAGGYPYTFTLVNEKSINAFALPGGPTFVFTGLLSIVDKEAELAGVLAHETAHVALRHGTHQATNANLMQIPVILASVLAGNSLFGQLTQIGIGVGANSVLLMFSRESEIEADALGTHLMAQAGYNPIEMAHFFEKLEAHAGPQLPQLLSDHPNPGNRVRSVGAEIRTLPRSSYGFVTGDFARAKSELGKISVAKAAGLREPSGAYRQLKGRKFSFSYPENWQPVGEQRTDSVILGNPQGGYGIIALLFAEARSNRFARRDRRVGESFAHGAERQPAARAGGWQPGAGNATRERRAIEPAADGRAPGRLVLFDAGRDRIQSSEGGRRYGKRF
jgi:Zn-dependent protease with chaperone function